MKRFLYRARSRDGVAVDGTLYAETSAQAARSLLDEDIYPFQVTTARGYGIGRFQAITRLIGFSSASRMSAAETAALARSLSELLHAGHTVPAALARVAVSARSKRVSAAAEAAAAAVRNGRSLAEALTILEVAVPGPFIGATAAAESAGRLPAMLATLADMYEKDDALAKSLRSALTYPLIVAAVAAMTVSILVGFVLPRVTLLYAASNQALPAPTRLLIEASAAVQEYGAALVAIAAIGAVALTIGARRRNRLSLLLAKTWYRVPALGTLQRLRLTAQFSQSLAALLSGGLTVRESLELIAARECNSFTRAALAMAIGRLDSGVSLSDSLVHTALGDPTLLSNLRAGEDRGALSMAANSAATAISGSLKARMASAASLAGPILVCATGLLVLFVVAALMLPLAEITL